MKCLRVAFVVSALLLASSAKKEERSPELKELMEIVDGCLAFFDKTKDDLVHLITNDTLDDSTDFPAKMTLCVYRGVHIFNDEDNDKFSLAALVKFLTAGAAKEVTDKGAATTIAIANECGEKVESSASPILEKAKLLINCLLSLKSAALDSDEAPEHVPTTSTCEIKCTDLCTLKCQSTHTDERSSRDCTLKCTDICHYKCKTTDTKYQ